MQPDAVTVEVHPPALRYPIQMAGPRAVHQRTGKVLAEDLDVPRTIFGRAVGLMFRRHAATGAWNVDQPVRGRSIHMMFMSFAIDAVFLDRQQPREEGLLEAAPVVGSGVVRHGARTACSSCRPDRPTDCGLQPGDEICDRTEPVKAGLTRPHTLECVLDRLVDLVLPPRCGGCHLAGSWLCERCRRRIRRLEEPMCRRCGAELDSPQDDVRLPHAPARALAPALRGRVRRPGRAAGPPLQVPGLARARGDRWPYCSAERLVVEGLAVVARAAGATARRAAPPARLQPGGAARARAAAARSTCASRRGGWCEPGRPRPQVGNDRLRRWENVPRRVRLARPRRSTAARSWSSTTSPPPARRSRRARRP